MGRSPRRAPALAAGLSGTLALALALGACGSSSTSPSASPPVYSFGVVGSLGKIAALEHDRPTAVGGITGRVVQVATSNSDGYALTTAGTVWAWGAGAVGELGDGQTPRYVRGAVRVAFPAGVRIVSLADPMPFDGALAVDAHGRAWGWGLDASGDLCLAGLVHSRPAELPLDDVTLVTGARTHALLDAGGRLYACGSGDAGELGTGTTANASAPVAVSALADASPIVALTSSWEGSGALLADGRYYDWGYDAAGQLGDGSTADSAVPVAVPLPVPVRQVFQGGSGATNGQSIALLADGSVWTWGDGRRGQLGDGSTTSSDVPVQVDVPAGVRFVRVASSGYSCYAVDSRGLLWAWGGNQNGQLGTGAAASIETRPVEVGLPVSQVSSTASNVAALGRQPPAGR